jgi:hypothetical protein
VHPSPGHNSGTLVNAVLFRYGLPSISAGDHDRAAPASLEGIVATNSALHSGSGSKPSSLPSNSRGAARDDSVMVWDDGCSDDQPDDEILMTSASDGQHVVLRPGIVHRLDKGTTGLMVVCRSDLALLRLGEQFRERKVRKFSSTCGLGSSSVVFNVFNK